MAFLSGLFREPQTADEIIKILGEAPNFESESTSEHLSSLIAGHSKNPRVLQYISALLDHLEAGYVAKQSAYAETVRNNFAKPEKFQIQFGRLSRDSIIEPRMTDKHLSGIYNGIVSLIEKHGMEPETTRFIKQLLDKAAGLSFLDEKLSYHSTFIITGYFTSDLDQGDVFSLAVKDGISKLAEKKAKDENFQGALLQLVEPLRDFDPHYAVHAMSGALYVWAKAQQRSVLAPSLEGENYRSRDEHLRTSRDGLKYLAGRTMVEIGEDAIGQEDFELVGDILKVGEVLGIDIFPDLQQRLENMEKEDREYVKGQLPLPWPELRRLLR